MNAKTEKDPLAPPAKDDAKAENKKAPKTKKEVVPKRSKFQLLYPDASKITLLAKDNPKKEGSKCRERFQHYFSDSVNTIGDFIAAGGTYADVAYDVGRRFISVEVVADPAPVSAAKA